MLQSTEYSPGAFLRWWWRTNDFASVMKRRTLDMTKPARLLLLSLRIGIVLQVLGGLLWLILGDPRAPFGLAVILFAPILWAHLIVLPLLLGRWLIVRPKQARLVAESRKLFHETKATKIVIAGSFGKTSMKELLVTVLSEGKKVVATPGNKNVAISHAYFAQRLQGDENIMVIELGEGEPGDVAAFTRNIEPDYAVITGIAPAHLDKYHSTEDAAKDIFSVSDGTPDGHTFVNATTERIKPFIGDEHTTFDGKHALGHTVANVKVGLDGTGFTLSKGKLRLRLHSQLIGRHQVAALAFVAAFALELGLSAEQVFAGIAKTMPYEHRMQPYQIGGAWIIDDTYNGNIEGIRAGTELIAELDAKRKIYVTPGLVDQGSETKQVHEELGQLIAAAKPDMVVLMQNSVTEFIQNGLEDGGYNGEVRVEDEPLHFYQNLDQLVAAGDIVLMQNDWTDNYA